VLFTDLLHQAILNIAVPKLCFAFARADTELLSCSAVQVTFSDRGGQEASCCHAKDRRPLSAHG
jgi:hypothetical protein